MVSKEYDTVTSQHLDGEGERQFINDNYVTTPDKKIRHRNIVIRVKWTCFRLLIPHTNAQVITSVVGCHLVSHCIISINKSN